MSIEGLWAVRFGHVGEQGHPNGGVVVFESGKVFGGDSFIAYTGEYELQAGRRIVGEISAEQHCEGGVLDAWGSDGGKFDILVVAELQANGEWAGRMSREGHQPELAIRMRKLRELP